MAWFPGAIRKPVTRFNAGGDKCVAMDRHRGVCLHIAVSEGASLFNYFNQPGNPCSHFYVRKSGAVEQYVDTQYRAPAQLEGNPSMIGVETQGGVTAGEKWTVEQLESIAQIEAWCNRIHNIPLIPMPSSRSGATGIGYHRLGINPWRVDGGEVWSTANGKTCPEDQRIGQIPTTITRAKAINAKDDDMAWTDADIAQFLAEQQKQTGLLEKMATDLYLVQVRTDSLTNRQIPDLRQEVRAIGADVDRGTDAGPAGPDADG